MNGSSLAAIDVRPAWSPPVQAPLLLRAKMPELDSLRGIAILAVLFYHGFYWANSRIQGAGTLVVRATEPGWAGVDLFFALSGFLITGILLDSRRESYFRNFYVRRVLRIWPAYFGLIGLLALTVRLSPTFVLASTFFVANLAPILGWPMQYGPLWSLAVEEQFYLVWPLLVRFVRRAVLVGVLAGVLLVEPLLRLYALRNVGPTYALLQTDHLTWLHLDGLALGALLAIFVRFVGESRRAVALAAGGLAAAAGAIVVLGAPFGALDRARPAGAMLLLTVLSLLATAAVATFLLVGTSRWRALVTPAPLRFFGDISYGLYLVHVLAFDLYDRLAGALAPSLLGWKTSFGLLVVRFVISGSAAVGLAVLSRRYFEEFFLRQKRRFTRAVPQGKGGVAFVA